MKYDTGVRSMSMHRRTVRVLAATVSLLFLGPATALDGGGRGLAPLSHDPHAHHRHMMNKKGYKRSEHEYGLPDLDLVGMGGEKTSLLREINTGKPVLLNFIFTTCTTICPVLSATFSQVQKHLGGDVDEVRMISITIDPEHDTPERLEAYAARFGAGPQWQFLTGDLDRIVAVQKAFDAYRGSKMNHEPLTFLRIEKEDPWVRLDGLASAADVVREYQRLATVQNQDS
ncbi:MAG: SCO family protein [bacterium]|nr:SCO family protein [bacterium]